MSFWNRTALTVNDYFYAAAAGTLDTVKECIRQGVDKVAKSSKNGMTALHIASWNGHLVIVKYLIDTCHLDKEAKSNDGSTALHFASNENHLEVVKYLIETCHVDKKATDNSGSTALHSACRNGSLDIVKYLIETCHLNKEAKDNHGMTALHCASQFGPSEIVKYLIEKGHVDKDAEDMIGSTALHVASRFGHLEMVKYLTETGHVDKEAKNNNGWTALHCASSSGKLEIVKYLIAACHVDKEAKNNYGWTALHCASSSGKLEIVKYLTGTCRVNKEAKDDIGSTALHFASGIGHLEIVKYLIEKCQIAKEAKSNDGSTSLHMACANGHLEIVQYLVAKGHVDKEAKDIDGRSAHDIAMIWNKSEVAQFLMNVSEDVIAVNGRINMSPSPLEKATNDQDNDTTAALSLFFDQPHSSIDKLGGMKTSKQRREGGKWKQSARTEGTSAVNGNLKESTTPLEKPTKDQAKRSFRPNVKNNNTAAVPLSTDQPYSRIGNVRAITTTSERREEQTSKQPAPTLGDFFRAATGGNLDKLKDCIKHGMNKEVKVRNGWGALHLATFNGHLEIVKYLIETCLVDTEAKSNYGATALHCASGYDRLDIVRYLIETCHVDREAKSNSGWTALHCASGYGRLEIVKYLIETGLVDKEAKDYLGSTALHIATANGHLEIVQYLVAKCHVDKDAKNNNGQSANDIAMTKNKSEVAQYLMNVSKDVIAVNGSINMSPSPLEKATNDEDNDTTAALSLFFDQPHSSIDNLGELNINTQGREGGKLKQPAPTVEDYIWAAYNGNIDKVKICISKGVEKEAKNKYGQTALHLACKAGSLEMVKYLIQGCQVDTEAKHNCGWTSLHFASIHGHLEIVKYLIQKYQVNKQAKTTNGWTALHFACRFGRFEIVKYLIEKGHVDKEAKNNNGQSANDIAMASNKTEVVQYLLSVSADAAAVNGDIDVSTTLFERVTMDQPQPSISTLGASDPNPLVLTSVSNESSLPVFELNKVWMLSMQNENQQLVDKLSQMDRSIQFINERRDLLDLIVVEQCMTIEEQDEQSAILLSSKHRDFYLLLQRKLKCMIKSCETLSTGMVSVGGGDMRAFCARTISENGYNIFKDKKVGFFIASAVQWSKKNLAFVPFVDTIGSVFQVIVTLNDERDQYVGLARVADFATMACLPHYGATSLDVTIEKVARHFVRARIRSPSRPFVEKKDQFGKLKQMMIKVLADSGNTPAKEQASVAADCAFAHIMKPSEDSVLFDLLNDSIPDVSLAEALAATILGISVQDLKQLEPFPTSPPADAIPPTNDTPSVNVPTVNVSSVVLNGTSVSTTAPFHSAAYALSDVVAEQVAKVQKQEELIQQQNDMMQRHEELMRKQNETIQQLSQKVARLEKCADNDFGSGTTYAKPEEVFKNEIAAIKVLSNDVKGLSTEVTTIDYQVAESNLRILILEERFQYLESNTSNEDVQRKRNNGNFKYRREG